MKKSRRNERLALLPVAGFFGLYPLFNNFFYPDTGKFVGAEGLFWVLLVSPVFLGAGLIGAGIIAAAYIPWIRQTKSSRRSIFFVVFTAVMAGFYFFVSAKFASMNCRVGGVSEGCNSGKISFVFFAAFFWLSLMAAVIFKSVDAENRDASING